jgi:hypothetical protein
MKAELLLQHLNILFQTEGHKHCRPGWLNMPCPWCTGNPGLHLGWNIEKEYFYCWRCGYHPTVKTLMKLSGLSIRQIKDLIRQYGGKPKISTINLPSRTPRKKGFQYPTGTGELQANHKKYLEQRNFDPNYIEKLWGIKGTGPISQLDNIDYKHRILAPISWNGKTVSFQTRSIGKAEPKYKACPQDRELIQHKHILYGKQELWKDTGICVEGITDVWRFGPMAFAIFGISYQIEQVKEIVKHFKKVIIVFDDDIQALKQADRLVAQLKLSAIDTWKIPIIGDPGSMEQDDADHFVKEILK